jgi:type VI secretion system protein ImpA
MREIDRDLLLSQISDESPCGPDMADDDELYTQYLALEALAKGEDCNWNEVTERAYDLLQQTKDLRIVMWLTRGLVKTSGFSGLATGLNLIAGLVENYWPSLYPALDAEENNDPLERVNILSALCDREGMLFDINRLPLVESRALGRFSLRDIQIASGTLVPSESNNDQHVDMGTIEAAFKDAPNEDLEESLDAIVRSQANSEDISKHLHEAIGSYSGLDLAPLAETLEKARNILHKHHAGQETAQVPSVPDAGVHPASARQGSTVQGNDSGIRNRDDAVRMLDEISQYFNRHEPSSPVPMILERAKRLVHMSFLDIIRDIAPEGVSQAQQLGGVKDED